MGSNQIPYQGNWLRAGFTLAELLIALAILGVIATFTIPKILTSSEDSRYRSVAKESIAMVSGAYNTYKLNRTPSSTTSFGNLTAYMNYIATDTATTIDSNGGGAGTIPCSNWYCLKLHNGAYIYDINSNFGGSSATNAMVFYLDPDGRVSSKRSVLVYLYYDGKVRTWASIEPNTDVGALGTFNPTPSADPTWFGWD